MPDDKPVTIRDLYPHFNDQQLEEAEADLEQFLAVMIRIAERLQAEGYDLTAPDLTVYQPSSTIHDEGSESR